MFNLIWAGRMIGVLAALLVATSAAFGELRTWTGAGDRRLWSNPANWSGNTVPRPGDDVFIANIHSVPVLLDQPVVGLRDLTLWGSMIEVPAGGLLQVSTGTLNGAVARMSGGTIQGGAWTLIGSSDVGFEVLSGAEATFDGVVVNGTLQLRHAGSRVKLINEPRFARVWVTTTNVTIGVRAGETMRWNLEGSTADAEGDNAIELDGPGGAVTIDAASRWNLYGSWKIGTTTHYSGTMSLVNRGVILVYGLTNVVPGGTFENIGTLGTGNSWSPVFVVQPGQPWVNRGVIYSATPPGARLAGEWVNEGEISGSTASDNVVAEASSITLGGRWRNNGVIRGCVAFDGEWVNTGSVRAGQVRLVSDITSDQLGSGFEALAVVTRRLDNTGRTLTFPGGWYLLGGEIFGGTVVQPANATFNSASRGVLRDLDYQGDLELQRLTIGRNFRCAKGILREYPMLVAEGAVVDFPIEVRGAGYIQSENAGGTFALGPNCRIAAEPNPRFSGTVMIGGESCQYWSNRGEIVASPTLAFYLTGANIINEGVMTAETSSIFARATESFGNRGQVRAVRSYFAVEAPRWISSGPIGISDSPMPCEFRGTTTTRSVLSIAKSGTELRIRGEVDNTGAHLELPASLGDVYFRAATIRGGTMRVHSAGRARFGVPGVDTTPTTLSGVAVLDEVLADASLLTVLRMENGASLAGARVSTRLSIEFDGLTAWSWPIIADAPDAVVSLTSKTGATLMRADSAASLVAGPSAPRARVTLCNSSTARFENQALIDLTDAADFTCQSPDLRQLGSLRLGGSVVATLGTLQGPVPDLRMNATGTLTLTANDAARAVFSRIDIPTGSEVLLRGAWGCSGPIVCKGTLRMGGFFTAGGIAGLDRVGGTLIHEGDLDLENGEWSVNAATGSVQVNGGVVRNGTLHQRDGSRIYPMATVGFTIRNVRVTSDIRLTETGSFFFPRNGSVVPAVYCSAPQSGMTIAVGDSLDFPLIFDGAPGQSRVFSSNGAGAITIGPAGLIEARGVSGVISNRSGPVTLTVQGTLRALDAGGLIRVLPSVITNIDVATSTLNGGRWESRRGGVVDILGSSTLLVNNAEVTVEGGSASPDLATLVENRGVLTFASGANVSVGVGSATGFTNRGVMDLGPGVTVTVGEAARRSGFTQTASGVLRTSACGDSPGCAFGRLRVTGGTRLNGVLSASLVAPYAPACGSTFSLIDGVDALVGEFASIVGDGPTPGTVFSVSTAGADAQLAVMPVADYDRSGFVDFLDYAAFVGCFETGSCGGGAADINRDGFVDFFDYTDFVTSFETGC